MITFMDIVTKCPSMFVYISSVYVAIYISPFKHHFIYCNISYPDISFSSNYYFTPHLTWTIRTHIHTYTHVNRCACASTNMTLHSSFAYFSHQYYTYLCECCCHSNEQHTYNLRLNDFDVPVDYKELTTIFTQNPYK